MPPRFARGEHVLCMGCRHRLPRTHQHRHAHNRLEKHFWGKVPFERGASFLHFHRSNAVQKLVHMLKYQGRQDVGHCLGKLYASELKTHEPFNCADMVIPVPLHASKLRRRGYNQAACIARGLADGLDIAHRDDILERRMNTDTQTRKSRLERWQNVENIFRCTDADALHGKRILLVDDVVTTGSTMEACANALLAAAPDVKINFVAIAFASS